MEMEIEREELVVEERSELEATRRRRQRGKSSNRGEETDGEGRSWMAEEKVAEGGGGEADRRSVCLDADHDQALVEDDTSNVKLQMDDHTVNCEELTNGKSSFKNMTSEYNDTAAEEVSHILKNSKVENGSNRQKMGSNGITTNDDEIMVDEQTSVTKWSGPNDVGFDVERVLEEQDTHDLYCPNCHSCITKRVILRKRKRSVRQTQRDPPFKRVHEEHYGAEKLDTEAASGEMTNLSDAQEPDIFRCLSCFSFFIPTESGFKLFYLFEKGKENHVQSSEQLPDKKISWISSIFKVDKSKNKGSEPGTSKPSESCGAASGVHDSEQQEKKNFPPVAMLKSQVISQMNGIGTSKPSETYSTASGVHDLVQQEKKSSPSITVLESQVISQVNDIGASSTTEILQTRETPMLSGDAQPCQNSSFPENNIAEVDATQIISQNDQIIQGSGATTTVVLSHADVQIDVADQIGRDAEMISWDALKSIGYGGLTESIISLCVVSSAAGSEASTLTTVAMGLANFIGGFLLIIHELFELKAAQDEATEQKNEQVGRYWALLGRRANFRLHFAVAITSYILTGLLPPVIYGFSFRKSDDKEYKLIAVAAASLLCIALLAIGKAHIRPQRAYLKTSFYYLSLGVSSSALSYISGKMINRLLHKFGLFDHSTTPTNLSPDVARFGVPAWASY